MKSSYRVFPESGYILETYRGIIALADMLASDERRNRDPRCRPQFHLVADYRRANVTLSAADLAELAGVIGNGASPQPGRIALVLKNGRNYAFASLYKAMLETGTTQVECFVAVEAALAWAAVQPSQRGFAWPGLKEIPQSESRSYVDLCTSRYPVGVGSL